MVKPSSSRGISAPGGVREIPLTRGRVVIVDEADFAWLNQWRWTFSHRYARRKATAAERRQGRPSHVCMHREVIGAPDRGAPVDHIDGDGLNSTRANLRACTRSQNSRNTGPRLGRRFKGVYRTCVKTTWYVEISSDGGKVYLGTYKSEEEAARAYDAAALRLHGEFARLNFPADDPVAA